MEIAADMVRTTFAGLCPNHDRDRDVRVRVLEWEREKNPEDETPGHIVVEESSVEEKTSGEESSAFVEFELP